MSTRLLQCPPFSTKLELIMRRLIQGTKVHNLQHIDVTRDYSESDAPIEYDHSQKILT